MTSMRSRSLLLASLFAALSVARADDVPGSMTDDVKPDGMIWVDDDDFDRPSPPFVGVGWTIGNGLGFFGGDLLLFPARRLALDVQLALHREGTVYGTLTSYALAPIVRGYLWQEGSTPYAAVGVSVVRKTLGSLTWYRPGFIANAGFEWRWASGLAVLAGAGLGYAPTATPSNGAESLTDDGFLGLNVEAGIRYVFR